MIGDLQIYTAYLTGHYQLWGKGPEMPAIVADLCNVA